MELGITSKSSTKPGRAAERWPEPLGCGLAGRSDVVPEATQLLSRGDLVLGSTAEPGSGEDVGRRGAGRGRGCLVMTTEDSMSASSGRLEN